MKTDELAEEPRDSRKKVDSVVVQKVALDDMSKYYTVIADAVMAGLGTAVHPSDIHSLAARAMARIADGRLQCWALMADGAARSSFIGVITTQIFDEPVAGFRGLVIYSAYASQYISEAGWQHVYRVLYAWAKQNRCSRIVAYSDNPRVVRLCESFGANTSRREIVKEI